MAVRLFYSYSHKDEKYRETLETHLAILKRQGLIEGWSDRKIDPGNLWEKEIEENLLRTQVVLLLVSPNFLASDYCYETETIFALEQHKKKKCIVIPIIIRPSLWEKSHLSHLQALPKNAKPISTWRNKDLAWLDVANGILHVVMKMKSDFESTGHSGFMPFLGNLAFSGIKSYYINDETFKLKNEMFIDQTRESRLQKFGKSSSLIEELILQTLEEHPHFYLSISKIFSFGQQNQMVKEVSNWDIETIEKQLTTLLSAGKVIITYSHKGNKLYKLHLA